MITHSRKQQKNKKRMDDNTGIKKQNKTKNKKKQKQKTKSKQNKKEQNINKEITTRKQQQSKQKQYMAKTKLVCYPRTKDSDQDLIEYTGFKSVPKIFPTLLIRLGISWMYPQQ